MTAILMTRTLSGLAPDDESATAVLRRIKPGDVVRVDVRRPRNLSAHRRWWALCNLVYANSDVYPSPEVVHAHLKLLAGCVDNVVLKSTGEVVMVPKSMSFAAMDEDEFQDVWQRAVKAICEHILPGVTDHEIEHEIASICGLAGGRR